MKGSRIQIWVAVGAGLIWAAPVASLEIDFRASVDRTKVGQADPVYLTLEISSDKTFGHVPAPEISLIEFIVEGPSISTQQQMQMVNGSISTTMVRKLVYTLLPRRTGKITIGAARLTIGGQTYTSDPITLEVVPGSLHQRSSSAGVTADGQTVSGDLDENLFILADADRKRAYVGQQVTISYDLFYNFRLFDVGFKEVPAYSGFWAEELFVAQQLKARQETHEGRRYNAALLRQVALFPTSAGRKTVQPLIMSCEVPKTGRRRGAFDSFLFGGSSQKVDVSSGAIELDVLPLPSTGQPDDFSGAVGSFSIQAQAQPRLVPLGDPVTLRVRVQGQGSLVELAPPVPLELSGFKVYDPKIEEAKQVRDGVYGGSRVFEYILIPELVGRLEIPSVRLAYFDPDLESYEIVRTATIPISVTGDDTAEEALTADYGLSRKDILKVGKDIRHIKPDMVELDHHSLLYREGWFWAAQSLIPLAFFGLLLFRRHQSRLEGDVAYARRRRAGREAAKNLVLARELMQSGNVVEYHGQIHRVVTDFIADRLNLSSASLTNEEQSAAILRKSDVEAKTIELVRDLLEKCDFARFGLGASAPSNMRRLYQQTEKILSRLESLT